MSLDPRQSKNYEQSIQKARRMNQGGQFHVGGERLTTKQIAERAGCSVSTVHKWVRQRGENPLIFIARFQRRKNAR